MNFNMNALMKQAQDLQQKMASVQEALAGMTVTSSVGGGMVTVTANGRSEVLAVRIEKEIIDPEDPAMLQDLVKAAVNDAMQKARAMAQAEMTKLTGGINIPGLF